MNSLLTFAWSLFSQHTLLLVNANTTILDLYTTTMQAFTHLLSTLGCFSSKAEGSTKPHPKADPSARPKWNDGNPKFETSEERRRNNDKNDAVALGLGYGNMGSTG
jgi:hypothetical protein